MYELTVVFDDEDINSIPVPSSLTYIHEFMASYDH
jgi:hypothetical protein